MNIYLLNIHFLYSILQYHMIPFTFSKINLKIKVSKLYILSLYSIFNINYLLLFGLQIKIIICLSKKSEKLFSSRFKIKLNF